MSDFNKESFHDRYYPGDDINDDYNNLTTLELLRKDLIGELEAINQYERHARMTSNPEASMLFRNIANGEKYHVAKLMHLIMKLDPDQKKEMMKVMRKEMGPGM